MKQITTELWDWSKVCYNFNICLNLANHTMLYHFPSKLIFHSHDQKDRYNNSAGTHSNMIQNSLSHILNVLSTECEDIFWGATENSSRTLPYDPGKRWVISVHQHSYRLPDITNIIKSRRTIWASHTVRMVETSGRKLGREEALGNL
jgi:hypothetical protein